jgi:hypothetical protein
MADRRVAAMIECTQRDAFIKAVISREATIYWPSTSDTRRRWGDTWSNLERNEECHAIMVFCSCSC